MHSLFLLFKLRWFIRRLSPALIIDSVSFGGHWANTSDHKDLNHGTDFCFWLLIVFHVRRAHCHSATKHCNHMCACAQKDYPFRCDPTICLCPSANCKSLHFHFHFLSFTPECSYTYIHSLGACTTFHYVGTFDYTRYSVKTNWWCTHCWVNTLPFCCLPLSQIHKNAFEIWNARLRLYKVVIIIATDVDAEKGK